MLEMMSKSFCLCNFGCLIMRGFTVTRRRGLGSVAPQRVGYPIPHTFSLFQSSPNTLFARLCLGDQLSVNTKTVRFWKILLARELKKHIKIR